MSEDEAIVIMRHFHWNFEKMQNEWFEKEAYFRKHLGLEVDKEALKKLSPADQAAVESSLPKNNGGMCVICYESFSNATNDPNAVPMALDCGH